MSLDCGSSTFDFALPLGVWFVTLIRVSHQRVPRPQPRPAVPVLPGIPHLEPGLLPAVELMENLEGVELLDWPDEEKLKKELVGRLVVTPEKRSDELPDPLENDGRNDAEKANHKKRDEVREALFVGSVPIEPLENG